MSPGESNTIKLLMQVKESIRNFSVDDTLVAGMGGRVGARLQLLGPCAQWCWWERIWVATFPRPAPSERAGMTMMQGVLRSNLQPSQTQPTGPVWTILPVYNSASVLRCSVHLSLVWGHLKQETLTNGFFFSSCFRFFKWIWLYSVSQNS